jgi:hypothetical protein
MPTIELEIEELAFMELMVSDWKSEFAFILVCHIIFLDFTLSLLSR